MCNMYMHGCVYILCMYIYVPHPGFVIVKGLETMPGKTVHPLGLDHVQHASFCIERNQDLLAR